MKTKHDKLDVTEDAYSFFLFTQLYLLQGQNDTEYDLLYLEIRKDFVKFINSTYNTGDYGLYECIEQYLGEKMKTKYAVYCLGVKDDLEEVCNKPLFLGERHIDFSVLSHDMFFFDSYKEAKEYGDNYTENNVDNFKDCTYHVVEIRDIEE